MTSDGWREAFVVELRLREVPGPQIGEALAEVDAHCVDSGQTPAEAFGDPVDYAARRAAGLGKVPPAQQMPWWRTAWRSAATVAGTLGVLSGVDATAHGHAGEVTLGALLTIVLAPALIVAAAQLVLRPGLRHRTGWLLSAFTACIATAIVPSLLWSQVVLQIPGPAILAAGVVLLGAAWWRLVSGRGFDDRVVDPRSGRERHPVPAWFVIAVRFGLIAFLAVVVLVVVLVPDPHQAM
ncbi:MAG: hypothetical protein IRY85_04265 [Micromonosporaceae bacterium]|nr:hypothetical protein [Micromonosporaceae bacterium]